MNPQEHQHVRHKLARCGARFMRRGIPPRQGAVKRNVLLLPRLVDGRANRAFYRQRRRAVSPRNGRVDFHRHAARLNGLMQEIQNRIHQIVEAGQTRRHAERRQQTGNLPLRRDLRFRQEQLRRLRAGGCSGRRHEGMDCAGRTACAACAPCTAPPTGMSGIACCIGNPSTSDGTRQYTGAKFGLAAGTARTLTTRQDEKLTVSGAGRFASSTGKNLLQSRQKKMEVKTRQNKRKEKRNFQIATA